MLTNLRNAYPENSDAELEEIALASWGHMGRLAAEYVFLDRLFDFDPERSEPGRIEVSGIPIFLDLRDNPRPFIVFTAHTGNFELLPVAGNSFGLDVMVDRTRVVEGKSVSVRLDLGGRRIFKKKK